MTLPRHTTLVSASTIPAPPSRPQQMPTQRGFELPPDTDRDMVDEEDPSERDLAKGAYLAGANLAGANLAGADLAGANLAGANLSPDPGDLAGANDRHDL